MLDQTCPKCGYIYTWGEQFADRRAKALPDFEAITAYLRGTDRLQNENVIAVNTGIPIYRIQEVIHITHPSAFRGSKDEGYRLNNAGDDGGTTDA